MAAVPPQPVSAEDGRDVPADGDARHPVGDDDGRAPCQRRGDRRRPLTRIAEADPEDRRLGLFHPPEYPGTLRRCARSPRSGRCGCHRRDSRRFRTLAGLREARTDRHRGQRRERREGQPRNAVSRADRHADPRGTAQRAGTAAGRRSRRRREPLQPDARLPPLHDTGADDHAAGDALRLPAGAEPRKREGDRNHRADQRHARQPADLHAGQADPLLGDRNGRAGCGHAAGMDRLRTGSGRKHRGHLPGRGALRPHHVGGSAWRSPTVRKPCSRRCS